MNNLDITNATLDNSEPFINEGEKFIAKVVDVYDGDTCTIIFIKWNKFIRTRCRLFGINTPELRPRKDLPNRDDYIEKAYRARDVLRQKILNKIVGINCHGWGKYSDRILGDIYLDDLWINKWLIDEKYAEPYDK